MNCFICNQPIGNVPLCYGSPAPYYYLALSEEERAKRCEINDDLCVIDGRYFFVRGRVEIPIVDSDDLFCWNVWVSLSEDNFIRMNELWNVAGRENEDPYFGWLSTELPEYPSTLSLKTEVITQPVGLIPKIFLEPSDHPLSLEQRNGITMERVFELAHLILHNKD